MDKELYYDFPPLSKNDWENRIKQDLKGKDYNKTLMWELEEELLVRPYYQEEDLQDIPHVQNLCNDSQSAIPGLTGVNSWEIRQKVQEEDLFKANAEGRFLIENGADSVAFAVQKQYASSRRACVVSQAEDLQKLFTGINPVQTPIHLLCGLDAPAIVALLPEFLEISQVSHDSQVSSENFFSCIDYDIFSHWISEGGLPCSQKESFHQMLHLLQFCASNVPKLRCIHISGYIYHLGGADPLEELGIVLAMLHEIIVYFKKEMGDEISFLDTLLPRLWFSLGISSDYFLEIARFRAIRLLFSRVIQEYNPCLTTEHFPLRMYIHGETLPSNKTFYDAHTNILRTSTEGMAAVLGGADSVSGSPFDMDYGNDGGSNIAIRLAVHTQLIQRHEAYLGRVSDPASGSYYIEKLTDFCAQRAWLHFQAIEKKGGLISMMESGELQKSLAEKKEKKKRMVGNRKKTFLGLNQFPPDIKEKQLGKLSKKESQTGGKDNRNIGIHHNSSPFEKIEVITPLRLGEEWEKLRLSTEKHGQAGGKIPKVTLLKAGKLSLAKARADFSLNLFSCAAYVVSDGPFFPISELDQQDFSLLSDSEIIVACAPDQDYPILIEWVQLEMRKKDLNGICLIIAGNPRKITKINGISGYVYQGMNALEELKRYHTHFGIAL